MRRLLFVLFFHFIAIIIVQGQSVRRPLAAPLTQLLTFSSLHSSAFNMRANQAALARLKEISAAVYAEKRYNLKELSQYAATIGIPTSSGNFGISGDYFGDLSYNESGIGLAYSRRLSEKIDIGVQFNYYNIKSEGYGSAFSVNAEGGIIFHLTESLNIGFHMYNPMGSPIGKSHEEKLPAIYSAGFGYDVSSKVFIGATIEKQESEPLNLNAGLHYFFEERMSACAGISAATSSYYMGFGIGMKSLHLNMLASLHPQLGVTPGLLLTFNPSGKAQHNNE